jgi:hypothetical protein
MKKIKLIFHQINENWWIKKYILYIHIFFCCRAMICSHLYL